MTTKACKQAIRRQVRDRVARLDPDCRAEQELCLAARLPDLPGFATARSTLMYLTAFDEIETGPMLRRALESGKHLVCPRVNPQRPGLDLLEIVDLDRDVVSGWRGIREPAVHCRPVAPAAIDWALVPGLAFDRRGFRLGRGGGYYDRLLTSLRGDAACWALLLDAQWVDAVPLEPHDQPLSGVADHRSVWLGERVGSV